MRRRPVIARLETVLTQGPPFPDDDGGALPALRAFFSTFLDLPGHLFVDGVCFLVALALLLLGHGTSACVQDKRPAADLHSPARQSRPFKLDGRIALCNTRPREERFYQPILQARLSQ